MTAKRMNGAQILLECLAREGVEVIYGYPGGVVLPLYHRFPEYPQLKHVLVRHEQGAAHAADGYARASGRLGVCLATSGPGATNLVTGIATAWMDSVPLLAVTGNVARNLLGKDGFQEADITGITMPITKHNYLVMDVDDLAYTVREAIYIATTGRRGPVLVDIPKDVFIDETSFQWPEEVSVRGYKPTYHGHVGQMRKAAKLIDEARRPLILAGHGVIASGGHDALRDFAEKAGIPVLTTFLGIGSFPADHVLSYGWMGMHGAYHANQAANHADLIIAIGMRFDDRAMGRYSDFNPGCKIVHIDIDPAEIGKNLPVTVPIVGDVKVVLAGLIEEAKPNSHVEWLHWIDKVRTEHPSFTVPETAGLSVQYAVRQIWEVTQGEAVVVTGVGQHQMWVGQHYPFHRPRALISSGGLGTMGYEVPAAIGAAMARPGEVVWSVCGDGGFQMTVQELATAVDQDVNVKFAVMNNGYLGMVRQWQELFYQHNYVSVDTARELCQPDFVKLAEAYGIPARRATAQAEARKAIEWAQATPGPVLVEFVVEPEDNVWPMVPAGASLAETMEEPRPQEVRA